MSSLRDSTRILLSIASVLVVSACRDTPSPTLAQSANETVTGSEEPSPNARILPEPLQQEAPPRGVDPHHSSTGGQSAKLPPRRETARPWPIARPLPEDPVQQPFGAGYEMLLRFSWPEAQKSVPAAKGSSEQRIDTWPTLHVQILSEQPGRPAKMRWILSGRAFPLPAGTELRARVNRLGYALIWPNGRSYRIVPTGALHSLFADRRVDRMPFVEATSKELSPPRNKAGDLRTLQISTPLGRAQMVTTQLADLPYGSELLCQALLEFIRVRGTPDSCPRGELPLKFEVAWASEQKLFLEVSDLKPSTELLLEKFRAPPALPIFKKGELPPFKEYVFNETERLSLFPLTKTPSAPLAQALEKEPSDPQKPSVKEDVPLPRPGNEIRLYNALDRPLMVLMNSVPLLWLSPEQELPVYTTTPSARYSARDFFGEAVLFERLISAPAKIRFGETSKAQSGEEN